MAKTWQAAISELEQILVRSDRKFEILRDIDRSILDSDQGLKYILERICADIVEAYAGVEYFIFSIVDENVDLFSESTRTDIKKLKNIILKTDLNTGALMPISFTDSKTCYGIKIPFLYDSYLVFIFTFPSELDHVTDFGEFMKNNFLEQVSVLIRYVNLDRQTNAKNNAYEIFFDNKLKPTATWRGLLKSIELFIPKWNFLSFNVKPMLQLLIYSEGDEYLRIVAGKGSNSNKFILTDKSVCGKLIKDRSRNFLLEDPQDFEFYMGYGEEIARTELAVRLDFEGVSVGVVNVEHRDRNAFNSVYVECVKSACEFLAPIVSALQIRHDSLKNKEVALLYVFTDMLSRMGDTYGHLVSQPLFSARNAMSELRYIAAQDAIDLSEFRDELDKLGRAVDEFQNHSDDFTKGLPDFVAHGRQPVREKIEDRLLSLRRLADSESISIEITETEPNLIGYASSLFQEHIFNIVNNSFQQIRMGIFIHGMKSGIIRISISLEKGITPQQSNTELNYINIVIEDNGGGAPDDVFPKIGLPRFTTKEEHGTGYGVAAAREYFESIGGDMVWENIKDGFRTTIRIQEFNSKIHHDNTVQGITSSKDE